MLVRWRYKFRVLLLLHYIRPMHSCFALDRVNMSGDGTFCVRNGVTEWDGTDDYHWSCPEGCDFCAGASVEGCMGENEATFATHLSTPYSLPILHETAGLMCYRTPVPDMLACDPLTPVLGGLNPDDAGVHSTMDQCFKFEPSGPTSPIGFNTSFPALFPQLVLLIMKCIRLRQCCVFQLISIFTFDYRGFHIHGPYQMITDPLGQRIVNTFNNPSLDWSKLLAWVGETTGFSPDKVEEVEFPAALELAQTSPELQLFNRFSTLCASACLLGAKWWCLLCSR